jgi:Gram-negative bacterial tonB protein.
MAKNNWLIPSLIALGIISVALSLFISTKTEKAKPGQRPLARAVLNLGKVSIFRHSMTTKEALTKQSMIFNLDSLETSADGDVDLFFDAGDRLHVQENSLITFDEENGRTTLIIKRGDVQVTNSTNAGNVFISREGVRWAIVEYEEQKKKIAFEDSLPETALGEDALVPQPQQGSGNRQGLSTEAIQDTLKLYRGNFFKCYTQLLQRTPGVSGQSSLAFTIERSGKVISADVASSSLQDPQFKRCLTEAIRRVEFKSFSGEPISTVFPLKFE